MPDCEFSESNGYSTAGLSYICPLVDAVKKMPPRAQLTALQIAGKTVPVNSANDVLVSLAKHLWTFKGWKLQRIIRTRDLGWLKTFRYGMSNPYQIDQDCYIDLNGSGSTPFLRALKLIEWCNLSNDDVRVTYRDSNANEDANSPRLSHSADDVEKTNESTVQYGQECEEFAKCDKSERGIDELLIAPGILEKARQFFSHWETKTPKQAVNRAKILSHPYENQIAELLEAEFPNGVRPSSIIDRNKIRKFYHEYFDEVLPEDFDFNSVLPRIGVIHDEKVFPRPSSKDGGWRKLIERLVGQGYSIFQFSRLMEFHGQELMQIGIISPEMLREAIMREAQDTYQIEGECFVPKWAGSVTQHFNSIIMSQRGPVIDISVVSKRVPYVDMAFIRSLCRRLSDLVRNGKNSYAIVSRIEFDDAEVSRGKSQCETAIKAEGFFSLSQLCLNDSAAMNDRRLVDSALRRSFFQRFLSEQFDIHGQIVCAKGASIDGQIPLHAFLRERPDVSLEQLETVAKEYNIAPWLALKTAHEEMVRVDRERFVSPALITFDVPSIEKSISDICEGCIMPFGAFGNLADFPAVPGFAWNEFLLEAFLRRASTGFRLVSPSVPARDVSGAVVPCMNCEWSAEDAFATIALRCGVAADVEEVGDFLVATQCVLRRSTKTVGAVVSRMKELEKR